MNKFLKRLFNKVKWYDLRTLEPISNIFGFDRGTPIDRIYIEDFLEKNRDNIRGVVCEIADSTYSKKFGNNITKFEVFDFLDNENATIVGDLSQASNLPDQMVDCFIVTQTLNFIYDFQSAIEGLHKVLKTEGVALVTVAGISQISRYDMDRWGDYWRFTDLSIKKAFSAVFGEENVIVDTYGNILTATSFLHGISSEELSQNELFKRDNDYQVTITIKAIKK
jgi:hypothetical protein